MQNACVYQGCTGAAVPGDYATIQAAVTALAPIGGTICLTAPSYTENVTGTGTAIVTIQGVSAASTMVTGELTFNFPANLQGFQVSGLVQINPGVSTVACTVANMTVIGASTVFPALSMAANGTVTASRLVATNGLAGLFIADGVTVLVDGVDASGQGTAIDLDGNASKVTVQNSYIHDSTAGVILYSRGDTQTLLNNTFVNAGSALRLDCTYSGNPEVVALTYENNLFVNNAVAVSLDTHCTMDVPPLFASNGYYGNTANFAGTAVEGTGDVKTNPLLQTTVSPPTLGAGSPAIGAGIKSVAPATDYWGNPRGASVDLGCVQSQ